VYSYNYARLFRVPKGSFFLFVPRGTGKTTLIESLELGGVEISLLYEARYQASLANPGLFYEEVSRCPNGSWVFVDEIQRLPGLLNEVHRLIGKKAPQICDDRIKRPEAQAVRSESAGRASGESLSVSVKPNGNGEGLSVRVSPSARNFAACGAS